MPSPNRIFRPLGVLTVSSLSLVLLAACDSEPEMETRAGETSVAVQDDSANETSAQSTSDEAMAPASRTEMESTEFGGSPVSVTPQFPDQIRAGAPIELRYEVANISDKTLKDVAILTTSSNFSPDGGQRVQNPEATQQGAQTTRYTVGEMGPQEQRVVKVRGVAQSEGAMNLCTSVEATPLSCASLKVVKPELTLNCSIVDEEGQPVSGDHYMCAPILVKHTVTNSGTGESGTIIVQENLPKGLTADGKNRIRMEVGSLGGGETKELEPVQLTADQPMVFDGCRAVARTDKLQAQASGANRVRFVEPTLAVDIAGREQTYLGRSVQYSVSVHNTSNVPAMDTTLRLEGGLDADAMEIGQLNGGQSRSFTFVADPSDPGQISAKVVASAYCAADATDAVTTQVVGIPALQLEVVDESDTFQVNQEFNYDIAVINEGSAEDLNVRVNATLPSGMQFVSGDGPTRVSGQGTQINIAPVKQLDVGEEAIWTVRVRPTQPGKFQRFKVSLSSDTMSRPITATEPTTIY